MQLPPIVIPSVSPPPRRQSVPLVAALVPVGAGFVLWAVTGSLYSLCFAALGPLMLVASLLDGARSRRRAIRRHAAEAADAWRSAEEELSRRHEEERRALRERYPDAAGCLTQPPLRGPDGPDAATELVIGSGAGSSALRSTGGDDEAARDFQRRCATIDGVPIRVPIGGGVAVRGPRPIADAVLRALAVQLTCRFRPRHLVLIGETETWALPRVGHASRPGAFRLALSRRGRTRPDVDAVLWALAPDDDVPAGITTVLDVTEPSVAILRTPEGTTAVAVEGLSSEQAASAEILHDEDDDVPSVPDSLALKDVVDSREESAGLPASLGRGVGGDVEVDIVADGPHAIVTGTTGTGKSELLVTWVTAMARRAGPDRVSFVLADFKGGTAFDPLRELPQVAAVITDLDEEGARRGVSSLTAELRRREAVLAAAGARDVAGTDLPRLVIVVDEFAALLQEHPDLGAVFTDIAARGRALGMHLIVGTQRAAGVIRDALAANCPLRLSLRVSDPADSRLVLGTQDAAELPGGPSSRGLVLVRRPQDTEPVLLRGARTAGSDIAAAARRFADAPLPASPWLPSLPPVLPLAELRRRVPAGAVVLGIADEPQRQSQPLELMRLGTDRGLALIGGPGSGRTSALRMLSAQHADAVWIPQDAEEAWDTVEEIASRRSTPTLVLCDDLDAQLGDLPAEYAAHLSQRWEQLLRSAQGTTFAVTSSRATGVVGRLLDALPRRALLRIPSRIDHLAAGGDAEGYVRDRLPGRARLDGREVQLAWAAPERLRSARTGRGRRDVRRRSPEWAPTRSLTAVVAPPAAETLAAFALAYPECEVTAAEERMPARAAGAGAAARIVIGDADAWHRCWSLWQQVRTDGEVLVRAEGGGDLRQLVGVRELPPFARLHAARAWSVVAGGSPRRVIVAALRRP